MHDVYVGALATLVLSPGGGGRGSGVRHTRKQIHDFIARRVWKDFLSL